MKRTILTNIPFTISILFILMIPTSCNQKSRVTKSFVWDEEVKELTGGNLHAWLQKAPFDNEFGKSNGEVFYLTNAEQVFPFMGRYYSAIEELKKDLSYSADTVIFQNVEKLFRDSIWGDLFLHATLLYDDQEVFLSDRYWEMGSPFFGGVDAVTEMHEASLSETSVFAKHPKYKTGIYWAWANYQHYLLGFYQRGQLVFETVVPLKNDTLASLNKLKEINKSLGLNISEWENAEIADLQQVEQPKTFWQDPFLGIYSRDISSDVYLKTKDTPFVQDKKARKGDYYFSYPSKDGDVYLYTVMQRTEQNKEEFNKANKKMDQYQYWYNNVFYAEQSESGYVKGIAKTYFMGNQYLEIHYGYPENEQEARQQVHSVLRYIKMLNYEE